MSKSIQIVWFKRDLRLRDHAPLAEASCRNEPTVLLYIIEPMLINDPHFDIRHWRFITQSITDLNEQLSAKGACITLVIGNAEQAFASIAKQFTIARVLSYEEVGLDNTYQRDKRLKAWFNGHGIDWLEFANGGVTRGLNNRRNWKQQWHDYLRRPVDDPALEALQVIEPESLGTPLSLSNAVKVHHLDDTTDIISSLNALTAPAQTFQPGGEKRAWYTLNHFLAERGIRYAQQISSPSLARKSCSRLSPYLAWGNITPRQVLNRLNSKKSDSDWRRTVKAFSSRIQWRSHFIQKFESECSMEISPVNKAYENYPYAGALDAEPKVTAWQRGETGFPLIDACIRAVIATGYLNFRMRAMLVSFLTHHLNVDWRKGVVFLGRQFLDFEPGIHYPQFQMQASVTGTNTIRLYNPLKQALDHDKDGRFTRKWVPELAEVPDDLIHSPWKLSAMEQRLYGVELGRDYPLPIIDIEQASREARDRLWSFRERDDVKREARRILSKHTIPGSPRT
ncbi:deoxyribodipyrimidine photo-lyase [Alteromonas sp. ASW11-36]|uniref:Deoxyribodipyrimidine photo-lyase n=1 Tax=Alteromonas arenosi TaxID=3055817 RepID=A0ABT7SXH1_9ALTE|nr:deoxyribodipyrimidine photo-lyase [Alteromonas sp. ASW11-36]MDM7860866.1 deoxyribodipyrimidine photo-lyase [Alteromonas sp. ASW11-36]